MGLGKSLLVIVALLLSAGATLAQAVERKPRVAALDLGSSPFGKVAADDLQSALVSRKELTLLDRDQTRAAALGAGYAGSLNMAVAEARDLGSAMGCDFFITGDAETLRRSSSERPVYYEAYAAIFLVSARTGKLLAWRRLSVHSSTLEAAAPALLSDLAQPAIREWVVQRVLGALQAEQNERARAVETYVPVIEEAPDPDAPAAKEVQTPRPYRRLRPPYPETAATAEAEATVDALADIDERGEVGQIQIVRWGGFGLDEATEATIRQLHFYPAMRNGRPVPMRVLLRYNFRKPPDPKKDARK
ncbi:MAG: hypothetical protein QOD75_2929 [Blastocatellia bacterium]|jgi:hypothetical protein|nr:hypothetical protein [Blastocatellia bacterium]